MDTTISDVTGFEPRVRILSVTYRFRAMCTDTTISDVQVSSHVYGYYYQWRIGFVVVFLLVPTTDW
jgi:hypothetical protein